MSHYYIYDKSLAKDERILDLKIKDISLRLTTDRGVFSKTGLDEGSKLLIESLDFNNDIHRVIDMGCGYGPITLFIAKSYPHIEVFAYDINERAVELTKKNSLLNQLTNVNVYVSHLFEHVDFNVDAVVTNPPIRAGKKVVFDLYEGAYHVLKPGGKFYVVIQKKQGAPSSVAKLKELFGDCSVIQRKGGYWILLAKKQEND